MKGRSHLRFRTIAPWYDSGVKLLGLFLGGERTVRGKVLDLLPLERTSRILEIGCGTGTVTLMAAERIGTEGSVVGIDPSPEMLERAKKKVADGFAPNISFSSGPGAPLQLEDGCIDVVICFLVLHEMAHEDRIDTMKEAARVLVQGGHFLVAELDSPRTWFGRLILRLLLMVEEEEAADFLSRGLASVINEGTGGALIEEKRISFALGIGQGVLYSRR